MKIIPYSINEANGNLVMSLAWNEDCSLSPQSPNSMTANVQTACETNTEENGQAA